MKNLIKKGIMKSYDYIYQIESGMNKKK